jgi:hypothetical protein
MWVFHIHNSFDWVDTPWPWDLKFELKHKFVFVCSHYEHETFQTCFENFSQIKVPTCYGLRLSSTRCRVWFNCTLSLHFYNDRHPLFGQPLTWKPPNPLSHWWLWLCIRGGYIYHSHAEGTCISFLLSISHFTQIFTWASKCLIGTPPYAKGFTGHIRSNQVMSQHIYNLLYVSSF